LEPQKGLKFEGANHAEESCRFPQNISQNC